MLVLLAANGVLECSVVVDLLYASPGWDGLEAERQSSHADALSREAAEADCVHDHWSLLTPGEWN
jgi:hypothetical protein